MFTKVFNNVCQYKKTQVNFQGQYVWVAKGPLDYVYFLNGDDIKNVDMCGAQIRLSVRPERI